MYNVKMLSHYYLRFTEKEIQDLKKTLNCSEILVEVDETGIVLREIGLNKDGAIVYKYPSTKPDPGGWRGLFDLTVISTNTLQSDLSESEFEAFWEISK